MKKYLIKPLQWEGKPEHQMEEFDSHRAGTPFGSYSVDLREGGRWWWGYCFDEYYDEDSSSCESLEEGKRLAEAHWIERISRALEEA